MCERERVNIFTLRESVHTVKIEGRMVSVDVMSVCVQLILSTSMEPVSLKYCQMRSLTNV